jgi:hypothetical protein
MSKSISGSTLAGERKNFDSRLIVRNQKRYNPMKRNFFSNVARATRKECEHVFTLGVCSLCGDGTRPE